MPEERASSSLCLACGLCCNGVIFADVQLRDGDDAKKLKSLGLLFVRLNSRSEIRKCPQPCAAFVHGSCGIYAERPRYCREFECSLLKSVKAGRIEAVKAQRIICETLQQVEKVEQLMRDLGDNDQSLPLGKRFRRVKREMEENPLNQRSADLFSRLTLAIHELNVRLSDTFYPGEREHAQRQQP